MPAPTHDAEVENVLSAIRRLIEDGRPEGPTTLAARDRLVLTPSLRVPEPPAPAPTMGGPLPANAEPLILLNALPVAAVVPVAPDPAPAEAAFGGHSGAEAAVALAMADPRPDGSLSLRPDPSDAAWVGEAAPLAAPSGAAPEPEPAAPWPDEATLRALVAEAVREELRGELGERLTRNLRRLVRREVMQALTARDLG